MTAALKNTTRTDAYFAAIATALSRPYHYRAGAEARARRIWNVMSDAERATVAAAWR